MKQRIICAAEEHETDSLLNAGTHLTFYSCRLLLPNQWIRWPSQKDSQSETV